jgi:hypothetical protein
MITTLYKCTPASLPVPGLCSAHRIHKHDEITTTPVGEKMQVLLQFRRTEPHMCRDRKSMIINPWVKTQNYVATQKRGQRTGQGQK